eukprot:1026555-Prymnesium_polylepis.1
MKDTAVHVHVQRNAARPTALHALLAARMHSEDAQWLRPLGNLQRCGRTGETEAGAARPLPPARRAARRAS